jgi:hypothetical protein
MLNYRVDTDMKECTDWHLHFYLLSQAPHHVILAYHVCLDLLGLNEECLDHYLNCVLVSAAEIKHLNQIVSE